MTNQVKLNASSISKLTELSCFLLASSSDHSNVEEKREADSSDEEEDNSGRGHVLFVKRMRDKNNFTTVYVCSAYGRIRGLDAVSSSTLALNSRPRPAIWWQ